MGPKKFAVVLAGCGVFDGTEIHEATLSLFEIMRQGGVYEIFAPDIPQAHVINHLTGEVMHEQRNVLVEAARIARGKIRPLSEFVATEFDVLFFPGGFGAAKNLSSFAFDGANMTVQEEVKRVILEAAEQDLILAALCIAPVIFTKVLEGASVTIGEDEEAARAIVAMGGNHEITTHGEVIIDEQYNLLTTPCYMLEATILDIAEGARNIVHEIMSMEITSEYLNE